METTPSKWRRLRREFSQWADQRKREPDSTHDAPRPETPLGADERAEFDHLMEGYQSRDTLFDWAEREVEEAAAPPLFAEGQLLAGRFQIVRFLGRGGMGEVYEATNRTLPGSRVALKTLNAEVRQRPDATRRFIREVELAQRVTHPNLCRIHDIFPFVLNEADGKEIQSHFLTMQLLEGESLAKYIKDRGKIALAEATPILRTMADALEAAHAENVIHRDLKPANIILVSRGGALQPIITDFGLAALLDRAPESDSEKTLDHFTRAGTPAYAAPEQLKYGRSGAASDIYSLGVVALEMLTGDTDASGMHTLPSQARKAIARCLEQEPGARFAKAPDFVAALEGQKPRPATRKHRLNNWVAGGILALALAGLFLTFYKSWNPRSQVITLWSTDGPAQQILPALSHDGKRVLYASNRTGQWHIYLQGIDSGAAVDLTANSPGDDSEPAFSPDERSVAFYSNRDKAAGGLYLMNVDGSHVRRLSSFGHQPSWSPDGRRIVFAEEALTDPHHKTTTHSALWVATLNGAMRRIYDGDAGQPRWSPSGVRIAFVEVANGKRMVGTISTDGGQPNFMTPAGDIQWSPDWSFDGRHLYFCSDRNGSMNLWSIRLNETTGEFAGNAEPLPVPDQYIGQLSAARGGNTLAYMQDMSRTSIYRVQFGPGGELKGLPQPIHVTSHGQLAAGIGPSADGKYLAYSSERHHENIYLAKTDDGATVQLTNSPSADRVPRWSPDGRWIAFQSTRSGKWEIWLMDRTGGQLHRVSNTRGEAANPVWSPDGSQLAFTEIGVGIRLLDLLHANSEKLAPVTATLPNTYHLPLSSTPLSFLAKSWSPDGRFLAGGLHNSDGSSAGIATQEVTSGRIEMMSKDGGESPVWLRDSGRLVYRVDGQLKMLWLRDLRTQRLFPANQYEAYDSLGMSTQGDCLFFTNLERQADIVVVAIKSY